MMYGLVFNMTIIYHKSKPFKQSLHTNIILFVFLIAIFVLGLDIIVFQGTILVNLAMLEEIADITFKLIMFIILIFCLALSLFVEEVIIPMIVRKYDKDSKEFVDINR